MEDFKKLLKLMRSTKSDEVCFNGEKWFRVKGSDGGDHWESETSRRRRALEIEGKNIRRKHRESLGIREENIEKNADLLMKLLKKCYTFGDPSFNPTVIYRQAEKEYGFEAEYTRKLVTNLVLRGIVTLEHKKSAKIDPREYDDYWRLFKKT